MRYGTPFKNVNPERISPCPVEARQCGVGSPVKGNIARSGPPMGARRSRGVKIKPMTVTSGTSDRPREASRREFKGSLRKFWLLCLPAVVVAVYLLWFGFQSYRTFGQLTDDGFPPGWIFYVIPWACSLAIFSIIFVLLSNNRGRCVVLTARTVEVRRGSMKRVTPWEEVYFTLPRPDKKRFRSALLSDGAWEERFEDFFFPDFDAMVGLISRQQKSHRDKHSL